MALVEEPSKGLVWHSKEHFDCLEACCTVGNWKNDADRW